MHKRIRKISNAVEQFTADQELHKLTKSLSGDKRIKEKQI